MNPMDVQHDVGDFDMDEEALKRAHPKLFEMAQRMEKKRPEKFCHAYQPCTPTEKKFVCLADRHLNDSSVHSELERYAMQSPDFNIVDISHNSLTKLPTCLHLFVSMTQLSLHFTGLHSNIDWTPLNNLSEKLEKLDLQGNQLTEFPLKVPFPRLTELSISRNAITYLPANIHDIIPAIRLLRANHNKLTSLPENLGRLSELRKIFLVHNLITHVSYEILVSLRFTSPNLVEVDVQGNPLMYLEDAFLTDPETREKIITSLPDQITEHIYLGGVDAALMTEALQIRGITHILTIADSPVSQIDPQFVNHYIELADVPTADLRRHLEEAISFMDSVVANNQNMLVHCALGASRSASLVIAYLMVRQGLTYDEAFAHVKKRRPLVKPNLGFKTQLLMFQKELDRRRSEGL